MKAQLPVLLVLVFLFASERGLCGDAGRRTTVPSPTDVSSEAEPHPGAPFIAVGLFGALSGGVAMFWGIEEIATEIGQGIGSAVACVLGCSEPLPSVEEASSLAAPAMVGGLIVALFGLGTMIYGVVAEADATAVPVLVAPAPGGLGLALPF